MNKTFSQIFPTFQIWESRVLNYIKTNFNNPVWLGTTANQEYIYDRFNANFGTFNHSLRSDDLLITKIIDIYTDEYPKKYNQDNNFNQIEWDKLNDKTDNFFRTIGTTDNIVKMSDLPGSVDNTFDSLLDKELVSNSQTSENINKNINLYQEYLNSRNANFVNTFRLFMEKFEYLFQTFVDYNEEDELRKYATFQTGEFVGDVPYLGLENQKDIGELYNAYDFVINNKQDKIVAGKNVQLIDNKIINVVGLPTFDDVYDLIIVSLVPWKNNIPYSKDTIVNAVSDTNILYKFQSLVDNNIDNNPFTSTGQWKKLENPPIDINEIANLVIARLKEGDLQTIINEELDKLPTVNYVSEYKDQIIPFKDTNDFSAFKLATGTSDSDYETIDEDKWEKISYILESNGLINFTNFQNSKYNGYIVIAEYRSIGAGYCYPLETLISTTIPGRSSYNFGVFSLERKQMTVAQFLISGSILFGYTDTAYNVNTITTMEIWGRLK